MTMPISFANSYKPQNNKDAISFGYTTCTFFDDFTSSSTIDLSNTKNPGFNWYVDSTFPNIFSKGSGEGDFPTGSSASYISVSNSILEINQTATTAIPSWIWTACSNSSGGLNGSYFGGGFYVEAKIAINPALVNAATTWPSFWGMAKEFLIGSSGAYGNTFVELDFMELYTSGELLTTVHEWIYSSGPGSGFSADNSNENNDVGSYSNFGTYYHTYGCLWVPMAQNSGTGLIQRYLDGTHLTAQDVTYTSGSNYAQMDSQSQVILLQAGYDWPMYVDYVMVMQA